MQQMSSKQDELLMHASELFDGQCHHNEQEDYSLFADNDVQQHAKNWALIGSALRNELPKRVDMNFADSVMARIREEASAQKQHGFEQETSAPIFESTNYFEKDVHLPALLRKGNRLNTEVNTALSLDHNSVDTLYSFERKQAQTSFDQTSLSVSQEKIVKYQNHDANNAKFFTLKRLALYITQIGVAASVAVVTIIGIQTYNISDPVLDQVASTNQTNNTAIGGLSLASYQNRDHEIILNLDKKNNEATTNNVSYKADIKQQQKQEMEMINLYVKGYVLDTAARK